MRHRQWGNGMGGYVGKQKGKKMRGAHVACCQMEVHQALANVLFIILGRHYQVALPMHHTQSLEIIVPPHPTLQLCNKPLFRCAPTL